MNKRRQNSYRRNDTIARNKNNSKIKSARNKPIKIHSIFKMYICY